MPKIRSRRDSRRWSGDAEASMAAGGVSMTTGVGVGAFVAASVGRHGGEVSVGVEEASRDGGGLEGGNGGVGASEAGGDSGADGTNGA